MSILMQSRYNPARGGHAPNDIRDAFLEAIEAFEKWKDGESEPTVDVDGSDIPISQVCGLLWNCTDILPGAAVVSLRDLDSDNELQRSSYAGGARFLRDRIAAATEN